MAIEAAYTGAFDFLSLYVGLDFIGQKGVKINIDKKHDRISLIDPKDADNRIVLDGENFKTNKRGDLTGGTITDIHFKVAGEDAVTIAGLHASAAKLEPALKQGMDALYAYLNNALTGNLTITGDEFLNMLEVGKGGTATIAAGDGDDSLRVWHKKNIVYDGGDGIDTIAFSPLLPLKGNAPAKGAVVDLLDGTGQNAYGGTLTLSHVENVSGSSKSDTIRGDDGINVLQGGAGGNDLIEGRGGDDTIGVAAAAKGKNAITADGGDGLDTLSYDLTKAPAVNRLDLADQSANTGAFANDRFTDFETFTFLDLRSSGTRAAVHFIGTDAGETVICAAGNDIIDAGGGDDMLNGGTGRNRFVFHQDFGNDVIGDFDWSNNNVIEFDSDVFASFAEVMEHVSQDGLDTVIDAGADGILRLSFFDSGSLTADDFRFV